MPSDIVSNLVEEHETSRDCSGTTVNFLMKAFDKTREYVPELVVEVVIVTIATGLIEVAASARSHSLAARHQDSCPNAK